MEPINWNLFGKCLRKRRAEARLTQKEVGARIGVTDTLIRYIEGAEKRPSRTIAALASEEDLLGSGFRRFAG